MSAGEPFRTKLHSFHELMRHRVQRILMISSLYDSFIMSEEGQLHETLLTQFIELNLSSVPDLVRVSSAAEALELLTSEKSFDLVVTSLNAGDCDATELTRRLRARGHDLPVIALAYTHHDLAEFQQSCDTSVLERIFLWQGDVRILLAMVAYLEDRLNVAGDTALRGVPAIIVVEDNIRFYSSFLPAIYSELYKHTHNLLSEDLNLSQRMMRLRARPKVLLCDTYEQAWSYFERYQDQILGVISDFEYPRDGKLDPHAGVALCKRVREVKPGIRLVMQSSNADNSALAEELGASFLQKGSPVLLHQLQRVLVERFGFGDFVFRLDGAEIDRASGLRSLLLKLKTIPAESLAYHAERDHFSNWLKARTEFALAERLQPRKVSDFESIEALREFLIQAIEDYRLERQRTVIAQFERDRFEPAATITRIGAGSLGGKARGVAFANRILLGADLEERFGGIDVYVPPSVVLGTRVFDQFLEYLDLRDYAIAGNPEEQILQRFLEAPFPRQTVADLREFLQRVKYPLAVRSSSLLEDSISQPFAGVYQTYMLPNNDPDLDVRWMQLSTAIKRVFASVFAARAKAYLSMTSFRIEEEKMAVMIQELVGRQHGDRFYPDFSGVARSHNFYPEPGQAPEDGVAALALGMGHTVVGGSLCLRFSPKYPRQVFSFSTVDDALASSQRTFVALDLDRSRQRHSESLLERYALDVAEEDGTLTWAGSTFSAANNVIVDGIARAGVRLVSFAQVLKHDAFPLAALLDELLERCSEGTGAPVEIEFAGNLAPSAGRPPGLAFLQLRPLTPAKEEAAVEIGDVREEDLVCRSSRILGNGRIDDLMDLVVVDVHRFDRLRTRDVALEVARFDAALRKEGRPYVLVGVGRWGTSDPSLGIPVGWSQIHGARVIVEAGLQDLAVAPSQGTHFFHNLTSSQVGYFTVNPERGEGTLDWDWLTRELAAEEEGEFVRRVRLRAPLTVKMSGRTGEGVILKPSGA